METSNTIYKDALEKLQRKVQRQRSYSNTDMYYVLYNVRTGRHSTSYLNFYVLLCFITLISNVEVGYQNEVFNVPTCFVLSKLTTQ